MRLSIFDVTWNEMRVGKFALMVPVMTSTEGRWRRHHEMDAGGARHLREALDRAFDVFPRDHHQVRHLVDHDDDEGKWLKFHFLMLEDRLAGLAVEAGLHRAGDGLALFAGFRDADIETVDVADAHLGHFLVALFHFAHGPFQRDDGFPRIGDDRREQMRDAVIDGKLQHLRVDQDQPAFFRAVMIEQRQDHRVDRDRLAGAGGAGDQQMWHPCEIRDHRLAADGLAETKRQARRALGEFLGGELLAQHDFFALRVRKLDADGVPAGHHRDARRDRAHGAGDIVGKTDHARGFDAGRGFQLIQRHHRAGPGIHDLALDAEIFQHVFQRAGILLECRG